MNKCYDIVCYNSKIIKKPRYDYYMSFKNRIIPIKYVKKVSFEKLISPTPNLYQLNEKE